MKPLTSMRSLSAAWLAATLGLASPVASGAATDRGAPSPTMPGLLPAIQIVEIDAPALSTRQSAAAAKQRQLGADRDRETTLAKTKAHEAIAEVTRKEHNASPDPAAFNRRLDLAERYAKDGKLQAAIRMLDQALADKPTDLPLPPRAQALRAALDLQRTPVEVTLKSDGDTYVSVVNFLPPQKFHTAKLKVLPGDYELKGARRDRTEVTIPLRVRNGEPLPPTISVVCH